MNISQQMGITPQPKARVRVRTHLTSVQINDAQKQTIDDAYRKFKEISGMSATKGQFIEGLAQDFLQHAGTPSIQDTIE